MGRTTVGLAKISNPFSTGGGGVNYERYVQAYFLFHMVSGDRCPLMKMPIVRMDFQAKILGCDTDDLVVTTSMGSKTARLLCQIKHEVTISPGNKTFQKVLAAAWSDFCKPDFRRDSDKIALIAATASEKSKHIMDKLHKYACNTETVEAFLNRVNTPRYTAEYVREAYSAIKNRLQETDDNAVWQFLKCFVLYLLDLSPSENNNTYSSLHSVIRDRTTQESEPVWSRLCEQCGIWNENAVSVESSNIPDDIISLFQKTTGMEIEEYISTFSALDLNSISAPFSYDYSKLKDIWGRDIELEQLKNFAEDESQRFRFCVVTGPAGIGKSKLVFYFGRMYQNKPDWLVRRVDSEDVQALSQWQNWDAGRNILLILDYANELQSVGRLLRTLSKVKGTKKIRVILIAREGTIKSANNSNRIVFPRWYEAVIKRDHTTHQCLFSGDFINLQGLTLEDCVSLHSDFVIMHLKRNCVKRQDEIQVLKLIEQSVMGEDGCVRPLYALFVMDLYYSRKPGDKRWNLEDMQKQIYERDRIRWKKSLKDGDWEYRSLFPALMNLLLYATIFGGWKSNLTMPPPLRKDCGVVFDAVAISASDPRSKWFTMLTGQEVYSDGTPVLTRLTPDMVGEYFALKQLASLNDTAIHCWADLMIKRLGDCKEFFVRAIQDFGNDAELVNVLIQLFMEMIELLSDSHEAVHLIFSSILEFFYTNYKGDEKDPIFGRIKDVLIQYVEKFSDRYACAAELDMVFHVADPCDKTEERIHHFERIEKLYDHWPDSGKIASRYISLLGDIVASKIGAGVLGQCNPYIDKFDALAVLVNSSDEWIKNAFVPALIKIIKAANNAMDWAMASRMEDVFLRSVMAECSDELMLDCINQFDSAIIELARQRAAILRPFGKTLPRNSAAAQVFERRLEKEISFFKGLIQSTPAPSFNFLWTYVSILTRLAKSLFIYENYALDTELDAISPYLRELFEFMLKIIKEIYSTYHNAQDGNALAWHASRSLDMFCDTKSSAIPYKIKSMCILWSLN